MPDTFITRPLSRSTSILKVRDRLNMLMGHSLHDDEDENICFEAPAARTLFHTHEDCLIYKYLLYRDRYKSKVHVLYFKWWLWFEDEKGGRMEELIETAGQLEIKMKDIHRTLQTAANEGKVLSTHIMRMGIEPLASSPLLEHGDCITLRADIGCAVPFFDSVAHLLLKDELYYPADMSSTYTDLTKLKQSGKGKENIYTNIQFLLLGFPYAFNLLML